MEEINRLMDFFNSWAVLRSRIKIDAIDIIDKIDTKPYIWSISSIESILSIYKRITY